MTVQFLQGDVIEQLKKLPDKSVNCVVTSPPYYGLRDYGTAEWEGGDPKCEHRVGGQVLDNKNPKAIKAGVRPGVDASRCKKCEARRIDSQLGLEPSIDAHIANIVAVFREVWRVLRDDGVVWLNYGDAYVTSPPGNKPDYDYRAKSGLPNSNKNQQRRANGSRQINKLKAAKGGDGLYDRRMALQIGHGESKDAIWGMKGKLGLKPKSLIGMPWRIALALMDDGWILRRDIIWSKPGPMPESATDRCTTAHEYVFHFVKQGRYWYDAEAIAELSDPDQTAHNLRYAKEYEAHTANVARGSSQPGNVGSIGIHARARTDGKRNKRSVWTVNSEPFPGAHFATFPQKLITPMIKAGCPQGGTVLDPFGGSGTVGLVASKLQRNAILIELNPEYVEMAKRRIQRHAGLRAGIDWSQSAEAKLCKQCGAPWKRQVAINYVKNRPSAGHDPRSQGSDRLAQARALQGPGTGWRGNNLLRKTETQGWAPSCRCTGQVRARRPKSENQRKSLPALKKSGSGKLARSPKPTHTTP